MVIQTHQFIRRREERRKEGREERGRRLGWLAPI
jgi:hypothetical protein